jgi:hypothetical protein
MANEEESIEATIIYLVQAEKLLKLVLEAPKGAISNDGKSWQHVTLVSLGKSVRSYGFRLVLKNKSHSR